MSAGKPGSTVHPNLIQTSRRLLESPNRFVDDSLLKRIPTMNDEELDVLPFGVIGLDDVGVVLRYNQYETKLAQREKERTIGKDFFRDVAPCTKTPIFAGLFFHGVKNDDLRSFVSYFFDFRMTPTHVWIHMHRCPENKTNWIFIKKKEGKGQS